jgi:hypothetical protein
VPLSRPLDELITKSLQAITHPDDLAADLAQIERMLDGVRWLPMKATKAAHHCFDDVRGTIATNSIERR